MDELGVDSSGVFKLGRNENSSNNNDISWCTFSGIFSLGDNAEGSRDISDWNFFRSLLDFDFLVRDELGGTIVRDELSSSSVLLTDSTRTVDQRHVDLGVYSLIDFETTDFANITSNTDNRTNVRDLSDHTTNIDETSNKISSQVSQWSELELGAGSIDNIELTRE